VAILTVILDATDNKGTFGLIQELPGLRCTIGEVDKEDVAENPDSSTDLQSVSNRPNFDAVHHVWHTYHSFQDENPPPA